MHHDLRMSATTAGQIVGASAAIIGTIVGGVFVLAAGVLQDKRARTAKLVEETRQVQRSAAQKCDELFRQLAIDIPISFRSRLQASTEESQQRSERTHSTYNELGTMAIDLPDKIRNRVISALELMQWADGIMDFHYEDASTIARRVGDDIHAALSAFLRNDRDLPPAADKIIEYQAAHDELTESLEEEFAEPIAEDEKIRARWLDGHPQVKTKLQNRHSSPPRGSGS
jgi:hypothetical protein